MDIMKVAAIVALALGSTWAARAATDAVLGTPSRQFLMQSGAAQPAPPVAEISREEMEAELRRAQAELGSRPREADMSEFRPSKPLPADLAIALPSDI